MGSLSLGMALNTTEKRTQMLDFGPQHPGIHGVLRLVIDINGEKVEKISTHLGFLHRGTEKLLEHKTYLQALPYFDRLDYTAPLSQEHAFVLAIEKLSNLYVPLRAQYIRVLFAELTRISSHLLNTITIAADMGVNMPLFWGLEEREKIMGFCERVSGARLHTMYFRPGGVANDLPQDLPKDIEKFLTGLEKTIDSIESLLTDNIIFRERTMDVGKISSEEAREWGLSGPVLRASGLAWDLRRSQPYDAYDKLDFQIPVGHVGDCFDRYLVRIREMHQSIYLIRQCLEGIPPGAVLEESYKITPPSKADTKEYIEAMMHYHKVYAQGFKVPEGAVYMPVESPKGEFAVYLVSDGSEKPYRCKIRSSGFAALQALESISKGCSLSDVPIILSSLDVVVGEVDR